jgi:hypothetical protein
VASPIGAAAAPHAGASWHASITLLTQRSPTIAFLDSARLTIDWLLPSRRASSACVNLASPPNPLTREREQNNRKAGRREGGKDSFVRAYGGPASTRSVGPALAARSGVPSRQPSRSGGPEVTACPPQKSSRLPAFLFARARARARKALPNDAQGVSARRAAVWQTPEITGQCDSGPGTVLARLDIVLVGASRLAENLGVS